MRLYFTLKTNESVPYINLLKVLVGGKTYDVDRKNTFYNYDPHTKTMTMEWHGLYIWNGEDEIQVLESFLDDAFYTGIEIEDDAPDGYYAELLEVSSDDRDLPLAETITRTIYVPSREADRIISYLNTDPICEEECFGEDGTYVQTADFGGGYEMDIKMCGVQYNEGDDNRPWTEAVLFHNGAEICHSDPETTYFGEWELAEDDKLYVTHVVPDRRACCCEKK